MNEIEQLTEDLKRMQDVEAVKVTGSMNRIGWEAVVTFKSGRTCQGFGNDRVAALQAAKTSVAVAISSGLT